MIFGTKTNIISAVFLCVSLWMPSAHATENLSLGELLTTIRPHGTMTVPFSESKTSPLTKTPAISSGIIIFTPPTRIEKRTTRPIEETTTIENGMVTTRTKIEKSYRISNVAIDSHPLLQASAGSMLALFTADEAALQERYTPTLTGSIEAWNLQLIPRHEALRKALKHIRLNGAHGQVAQVVIATQRHGTSTLTFETPQP